MNWGYKILFVYIAFVGGILLLVFKTSGQKDDLVTADYYARELKYQERIDAVKRTQALISSVSYEIIDHKVVINFPKDLLNKQLNGTVLFYCPSDDKKDFKQNFSTATSTFSMQLPVIGKGAYELQISWQAGGKGYYFENKLIL